MAPLNKKMISIMFFLLQLLLVLPRECLSWVSNIHNNNNLYNSRSWTLIMRKKKNQSTIQNNHHLCLHTMNSNIPKFTSFRCNMSANGDSDATTTTTTTNNINNDIENEEIDFNSLIDMDVVIYSFKNKNDNNNNNNDEKKLYYYLGAMQEDGVLSPLSVWTTEPAFGTSIEFLVDEEDRFSLNSKNIEDNIQIHYRLNESELSYGSRQCHRGVGNPHGEESELLYYVEQDILERYNIQIMIKPDLEILW